MAGGDEVEGGVNDPLMGMGYAPDVSPYVQRLQDMAIRNELMESELTAFRNLLAVMVQRNGGELVITQLEVISLPIYVMETFVTDEAVTFKLEVPVGEKEV